MPTKKRTRTRRTADGSAGRPATRRAASSALSPPRKLASGLPGRVFAQASPLSIGGTSMFDASSYVTSDRAMDFASEDTIIRNAATRLQSAGFDVLNVARTSINISGPPKLFEDAFDTKLFPDERPVIKELGREDTATFVDTTGTEISGYIDTRKTSFGDTLEGVAIEEPRYFFQDAFAPMKSYWHLRVPGDVSVGMNADRAHRGGISGRGVKVVMTDSGWYRHPYFVQRGYRSSPVVLGPGAANADHDEVGHGTAESANAFAVAPDIDFTMVKISFVNTTAGFNAAVALGPDIISSSWGSSVPTGPLSGADIALAAAVAAAVAGGIIVVFAAGNGHWGFPGQHPDVISAGGAYMVADGTFRASDYASGFVSQIYPGRTSPDVTGLVGMKPKAAYIMLPLEPGDQIDSGLAGGTHPNGDETAPNDGWATISGTSAAAPQIAGICALMKQACPGLTPAAARDILHRTARDVTSGTNGTANPPTTATATVGHDTATGHGLADAHKAVLIAKLRCTGVSVQPPVGIRPYEPIVPPGIRPYEPIVPPGIRPYEPIVPPGIRPYEPIVPPVQPRPPAPAPIGPLPPPIAAAERTSEAQDAIAQSGPQLTPEDVESLERMVIEDESGIDL